MTRCLVDIRVIVGIKNVHLLYTDVSVVGSPLAASKDLSDIAIDDDFSTLDEFLASSTEITGKYWD